MRRPISLSSVKIKVVRASPAHAAAMRSISSSVNVLRLDSSAGTRLFAMVRMMAPLRSEAMPSPFGIISAKPYLNN